MNGSSPWRKIFLYIEKGLSPVVSLISLHKACGSSAPPATEYRAPLERLIIRAPRVAGEGQLPESAVQNAHRMTSCAAPPPHQESEQPTDTNRPEWGGVGVQQHALGHSSIQSCLPLRLPRQRIPTLPSQKETESPIHSILGSSVP